ncbi:hypothetical protein EG68_08113 [Paragonimus skrjabini miyazakii]|uniref:Uncharacterized protein n=1 Tax=Paragonimus skrjabini miyazakii TaxID=59628 RepID=A0A8S9YK51_9TREM|nr:hypothetical protein EG68_08113 [Paragonimus skrjabini miyazakii]
MSVTKDKQSCSYKGLQRSRYSSYEFSGMKKQDGRKFTVGSSVSSSRFSGSTSWISALSRTVPIDYSRATGSVQLTQSTMRNCTTPTLVTSFSQSSTYFKAEKRGLNSWNDDPWRSGQNSSTRWPVWPRRNLISNSSIPDLQSLSVTGIQASSLLIDPVYYRSELDRCECTDFSTRILQKERWKQGQKGSTSLNLRSSPWITNTSDYWQYGSHITHQVDKGLVDYISRPSVIDFDSSSKFGVQKLAKSTLKIKTDDPFKSLSELPSWDVDSNLLASNTVTSGEPYGDPAMGASAEFLCRLKEVLTLEVATKRWERIRARRKFKKRSNDSEQ